MVIFHSRYQCVIALHKLHLWRTRRTVCVSCGGWEGGLAVETEKAHSQKNAKKRGAYPPSAARIVRPHDLTESSLQMPKNAWARGSKHGGQGSATQTPAPIMTRARANCHNHFGERPKRSTWWSISPRARLADKKANSTENRDWYCQDSTKTPYGR